MTTARPPCAPRRAERGFTLIELLVAIALMGIVSVLSWRGLDSIAGLRERLAMNAEATDRLMRMLGQIERDLAQRAPDMVLAPAFATPLPDGRQPPPPALPHALEVTAAGGGSARLRIVRADAAHPGAWQQVVWWAEDGVLRRAVGAPGTSYPLAEPQGSGVVVMPGVTGFAVRGYVPQTGWTPLPRPADVTTPVTGIEVAIQLAGAGGVETYNRIVAFP